MESSAEVARMAYATSAVEYVQNATRKFTEKSAEFRDREAALQLDLGWTLQALEIEGSRASEDDEDDGDDIDNLAITNRAINHSESAKAWELLRYIQHPSAKTVEDAQKQAYGEDSHAPRQASRPASWFASTVSRAGSALGTPNYRHAAPKRRLRFEPAALPYADIEDRTSRKHSHKTPLFWIKRQRDKALAAVKSQMPPSGFETKGSNIKQTTHDTESPMVGLRRGSEIFQANTKEGSPEIRHRPPPEDFQHHRRPFKRLSDLITGVTPNDSLSRRR